MVYWGADKTARKAGPHRAAFGHTASTKHSSTAVTGTAKGLTVYQYRHYKRALLAILRYI